MIREHTIYLFNRRGKIIHNRTPGFRWLLSVNFGSSLIIKKLTKLIVNKFQVNYNSNVYRNRQGIGKICTKIQDWFRENKQQTILEVTSKIPPRCYDIADLVISIPSWCFQQLSSFQLHFSGYPPPTTTKNQFLLAPYFV